MLQDPDHLSTLFSCLAHRRRRHALFYLNDSDEPQTLADVAEAIADREVDSAASETDREQVTSVRMSLYHSHVPKLEAAGLVQYEQDDDTVELVEYPHRLLDAPEIAAD